MKNIKLLFKEYGTVKYGCIDESYFSITSPRAIDGDEQDTLAGAFKVAGDMIEEGAEKVSIVLCRYSPKAQSWVEIVGQGTIQIDASDGTRLLDDDEEDDENTCAHEHGTRGGICYDCGCEV